MAVGFSSYQIARSGLTASERGLTVTGHNISNVDTTGYTRQQSISETSPYLTIRSKDNKVYQYGLGVDIQETRQIRHTFLDNVFRKENTTLGYYETRSNTMEDVQAVINDAMDDGLQNAMDQFWDSWQELSKNPESLTTRALVRERGQALVYYFEQVGTQLSRLQSDLNSETKVQIDRVNSITSQIAKLNVSIQSQEINGDSANDYRDQRNLLLDELSKLTDVQISEMQDGQIDILLDGNVLVTKGVARELDVKADTENAGFFNPVLKGTDTVVNIKNGSIKGLLESRGTETGSIDNEDIPTDGNTVKTNESDSANVVSNLKFKINILLNKVVGKVNEFSKSGLTLDGKSGGNFFDPINDDKPIQMGNIRLSSLITNEDGLNNIVAAATLAVGDNTIARKIANLRDDDILVDNNGQVSADEFYRDVVSSISNIGNENTTALNSQSMLVKSAADQRTTISGVSLDEEMSSMMKYKFAYDASSRVLNVIDAMMEKVITSLGVVGR